MHNKNTLSRFKYTAENLFWSALAFVVYLKILFCPVFPRNYKLSIVILSCTVIAGIVMGILLTYRHRRNYVSVFCNVVLSFGPYHIIAFRNITPTPLIVAGFIAAALIALYCILVLLSYRDARKEPTLPHWIGSGLPPAF